MGSFDDIRPFFLKHNISIPTVSNPVDYLINMINMTDFEFSNVKKRMSSAHNNTYSKKIVKKIQEIISENQDTDLILSIDENQSLVETLIINGTVKKVSTFLGFRILLRKYSKIYWRSKGGFKLRLRMAIFMLVFTGILFWRSTYDRAGIQNRKGALFFIMIYSSIASLHAVAFDLHNDRELLVKELTEGHYSITSYFLGKTFAGTFTSMMIVLIVCNIVHFCSRLNRVNMLHYF